MSDVLSGAGWRVALIGFVSGAAFFGVQAVTDVDAHYGCESATIHGTTGQDDLQGDSGNDSSHDHADFISAHDGNDRIRGYSCPDEMHGGGNRDHIHGAWSDDFVYGEDGWDEYFLGCETGPWCPQLVGGAHDDVIEGGAGEDQLSDYEGSDADVLRGGDDADWLVATDSDQSDNLNGGNGSNDDCDGDGGDSQQNCEL